MQVSFSNTTLRHLWEQVARPGERETPGRGSPAEACLSYYHYYHYYDNYYYDHLQRRVYADLWSRGGGSSHPCQQHAQGPNVYFPTALLMWKINSSVEILPPQSGHKSSISLLIFFMNGVKTFRRQEPICSRNVRDLNPGVRVILLWGRDHQRGAEVYQPQLAPDHHKVLRLDVAVDHTLSVNLMNTVKGWGPVMSDLWWRQAIFAAALDIHSQFLKIQYLHLKFGQGFPY